MAEAQTQLTENQKAYRVIGRALWRTVCRDKNSFQEVPCCLNSLMDLFALSEERGSVCVQWQNDHASLLSKEELAVLMDSGLLALKPKRLADEPDPLIPFVLDQSGNITRIYQQRHFSEEREVALKLLSFINRPDEAISKAQQKALQGFNGLQYGKADETDEKSRHEQQAAVSLALKKPFCIITGGPGTGKTTVVAKLLESLLKDQPDLKIALAAPTGKATSRIMQSLYGSCERFPDHFPKVISRVQSQTLTARTIHKWLLSRDEKGRMPSAENPLDIDVMIVDEASMIDLRLAKRLLSVLDSSRTRLILLGDKYQLSAVGPGSVLADMTDPTGPLSSHLAELTVSHRFTSDSNVGRLAQAIKTPESPFKVEDFIDAFKKAKEGKDQVSIKLYKPNETVDRNVIKWLTPHLKKYLYALEDFRTEKQALFSDERKLKALWLTAESFRILCAQRTGPNGVNAVNRFIETVVREKTASPADALFYPGRLIIIRKNTPSLDVYNGDVGIVIEENQQSNRFELYIGDRNKRIPVGLLPEHDTAFAMTIHQSQGSQFKHVAVLLPSSEESLLASRELFYTGVTRAQKEAAVFGTSKTIRASVLRKTERSSGLKDRLKE